MKNLDAPQVSKHYVDIKVVVTKMGLSSAGTPTLPILVRLIGNDTIPNNLYTEFSDNNYIGDMVSSKWLYNNKIGDTLFFKYIRKERFFIIETLPDNNTINNTPENINKIRYN